MHIKSIFHYFDLFKWKIEGNHELLCHMGYSSTIWFDSNNNVEKTNNKRIWYNRESYQYSIWLTNTWKITEARKEVAIHYTLR